MSDIFSILPDIIIYIVLGYIFLRVFRIVKILKFIDLLKIKHTKHKFMWQNIEDPDYAFFVDVTNPDTNIRYFGQLVMYEEFERFPMIQLCRYINWKNSDLLNDYSNDPTRTVLIDTSKYSEIDITYQKCSDFIKRWS